MPDFVQQRTMMVDAQIRTNDVTDPRIHAALMTVPRERFVPESKQAVAYMDGCVGLGAGRVLADPRSFGKLVQLAQIKPTDKLLDVGCGSGYSTAILSHMAGEVIGLEQDRELAGVARECLATLKIANAFVAEGALAQGLPARGPFDVIVCNGALEVPPRALLNQLADGGRLVAVLKDFSGSMARLYLRHEGAISERAAFDAQLPVLPGFERPAAFVF
jgi:protein-L-isoaspartate(D-aspartate) O-methyltransferase